MYEGDLKRNAHVGNAAQKMPPSVPPFQQLHGRLLEDSAVYFVSGGVCTWKRQGVEMAAVRVSGTVTNDDQRAYIKIETLRGKTPTEIHTSLMEVCGVETVDRSTISRWAHRFREIEPRERPEERTTPNVD